MKKIFASAFIILLILISVLIYFRSQIASSYLSHRFNTPVQVGGVYLSSNRLVFEDFVIKNSPNSQSKNGLYCKQISMDFHPQKLFSKTPTIDSITLSHTHIWVELYDKEGIKNNWQHFFSLTDSSIKPTKTPFLIKTLKVKQLSPTLVQYHGSKKRGPVIGEMTFHNISEANGFPFDHFERAVINAFIPATFRVLSIENLLPSLHPEKPVSLYAPFIKTYDQPTTIERFYNHDQRQETR